jgi:hypothetical protein
MLTIEIHNFFAMIPSSRYSEQVVLCKTGRAISLDFWQVGEQETTVQWTVCCTCFNASYSGSPGGIWRANAKTTRCSRHPWFKKPSSGFFLAATLGGRIARISFELRPV